MLDTKTIAALEWAVIQLELLDHDCKRSPDDGCQICDSLDALRDTIKRGSYVLLP